MTSSFKEFMTKKSDDGLMDYIINFKKYTPEAIAGAVDELKKRGRRFTDQELSEIQRKIETRIKDEKEEETLWNNDSWKTNIVTDPDAPLLYSKGAIRGFCIFFTTLFGAIIFSSNLTDIKKKWVVIGFGTILTVVTVVAANIIPTQIFYLLLLNTAGGLGLTTTFWDKYIGKDTKYRAKPIWKPLIVSIIISIPFLLAIIYSE